jgi:hypothetical protein
MRIGTEYFVGILGQGSIALKDVALRPLRRPPRFNDRLLVEDLIIFRAGLIVYDPHAWA